MRSAGRHCFFCGKVATVDKKHPGRNLVYAVLTLTTKNRLIGHCIEGNEEWGEIVKARLEHDIYLVAEEAIYHDTCQKVYSKEKNNKRKAWASKRYGNGK